MNQASFFCPHCNQQRLFQSTPMNHVPHILAAVFLCGLWLPVWIIIALSHQDIWRCSFCGFSDAVKYLQNPRLREHEQIAAEQKRMMDQRRAEENQRLLAEMPMNTSSDKAAYFWAAYKIPILALGGAVLLVGFLVTMSVLNSKLAIPAGSQSPSLGIAPSPAMARHDLDKTPNPTRTPLATSTPANVSKSLTPAKSRTATVISENANLRLTPDSYGEIVNTVEYGATVDIVKQKGAWFQVRYAGTIGWLHGNTIRLVESY